MIITKSMTYFTLWSCPTAILPWYRCQPDSRFAAALTVVAA